jgi:hypothetical protein
VISPLRYSAIRCLDTRKFLKSYESCGRIALTWINYVRYRTFISRHARLADGKRLFRRASLIISGIYSRSAEQKFLWSVLELTSIGAVAAEDRIEMFDTNAGGSPKDNCRARFSF